jgi:hypothetical protein
MKVVIFEIEGIGRVAIVPEHVASVMFDARAGHTAIVMVNQIGYQLPSSQITFAEVLHKLGMTTDTVH